MTDIVERLRGLRFVHVPVASQLMEEACQEIERLRNGGACPHVRGTVTQHCSLNFTLTDKEREALRTVIGGFGMWVAQNALTDDESLRLTVVTLRNLLARLS